MSMMTMARPALASPDMPPKTNTFPEDRPETPFSPFAVGNSTDIHSLEVLFATPAQSNPVDITEIGPNPEPDRQSGFLKRHVADRIRPIRLAAQEDLQHSQYPGRVQASRAGYLAVKAAGKGHAPSILFAAASMDVLAATESPLAAGATTLVLGTAWSLSVMGAIGKAAKHNPRAFAATERSFPGYTNAVATSIPALEPKATIEIEATKHIERSEPGFRNIAKRAGQWAVLHAQRGVLAHTQLSRYLVNDVVTGKPLEERRRNGRTLAIEGASIAATLNLGLAEVIYKLHESDPALAERMQHDVPFIIGGIGWGIAISRAAVSRFRRRKAARTPSEELLPYYPDLVSA
jgi:hypothetical protein